MAVNFIIRDITSVTATIWKITIRDKPSNCGMDWVGHTHTHTHTHTRRRITKPHEPNRNKNLNDGNTAVEYDL